MKPEKRFSKISVILFLHLWLFLIISAKAAPADLTIWLMNNEPHWEGGANTNLEKERETLLQNNNERDVRIDNVEEIRKDTEYARLVLGQKEILTLLGDFAKSNSIQINVRFLKWEEAFEKLNSEIKSDIPPPDVVQMPSSWTAYFAKEGFLSEIESKEGFYPPAFSSCQIFPKKEIYACPWFLDARMLYYWKEHIQDPSLLKNPDDFKKACGKVIEKLKQLPEKDGMEKFAIGIPSARDWNLLHNMVLWLPKKTELIKVYRFKLKRAAFSQGKCINAANFLRELREHVFLDLPEIRLEEVEERFINGRYAMVISGPWLIKLLGDKQNEVGVVPPPGGNTFLGGSHLTIPKKARQIDNAPKLIAYLTEEKAHQYASQVGLLPAYNIEDFLLKNPSFAPFGSVLGYVKESGKWQYIPEERRGEYYPNIPEWANVVERRITLINLHHLWKQIKYEGAEDIRKVLETTDRELNDSLFYKALWQYLLILIAIIALISALPLFWAYRSFMSKKVRKLQEKFDEVSRDRRNLETALSIIRDSQPKSEVTEQIKKMVERRRREEEKLSPIDIQFYWDTEKTVIKTDKGSSIEGIKTLPRLLLEDLIRAQEFYEKNGVHYQMVYLLEPDWNPKEPVTSFQGLVSSLNKAFANAGSKKLLTSTKGRKGIQMYKLELPLYRSNLRDACSHIEDAENFINQGQVEKAWEKLNAAYQQDKRNVRICELVAKIAMKKEEYKEKELFRKCKAFLDEICGEGYKRLDEQEKKLDSLSLKKKEQISFWNEIKERLRERRNIYQSFKGIAKRNVETLLFEGMEEELGAAKEWMKENTLSIHDFDDVWSGLKDEWELLDSLKTEVEINPFGILYGTIKLKIDTKEIFNTIQTALGEPSDELLEYLNELLAHVVWDVLCQISQEKEIHTEEFSREDYLEVELKRRIVENIQQSDDNALNFVLACVSKNMDRNVKGIFQSNFYIALDDKQPEDFNALVDLIKQLKREAKKDDMGERA